MTYYDILEISENASEEVIRVAYKALAKKYHPDVFKGDIKEAEEKMKQINAAFEVLFDKQKRRSYDDFLRQKRNDAKAKDEPKAEPKQSQQRERNGIKKEFTYPSETKSGVIIFVLLLVLLFLSIGTYAENQNLLEVAILLGAVEFCGTCLITMTAPILVAIIKKNLSPKNIKAICLTNSIAVYAISLVLYVFEIIPAMFIGWIAVTFYYFINKHILLQLQKHACDKKNTLITALIIFAILTSIVVGGVVLLNNSSGDEEFHFYGYDTEGNLKRYTFDESVGKYFDSDGNAYNDDGQRYIPDYYVDINGKVYDLRGYESCILVRSVFVREKENAQKIYDEIKKAGSNEEEIIAIMDKNGSESGGEGYLIEPGDCAEEIDKWCFAKDRIIGDSAIFEHDNGYSVFYISIFFNHK